MEQSITINDIVALFKNTNEKKIKGFKGCNSNLDDS